jgi:hypothetical protein
MTDDLSFSALKARQRELRESFAPELSLRVHRALSWLERAEQEQADDDAAFIFLWIAFNAAYAREIDLSTDRGGERALFGDFFEQLMRTDKAKRLYDVVWKRFPKEINELLRNKYVFHPFWQCQNAVPGYEAWDRSFMLAQKRAGEALFAKDSATILSIVFDRLYVLRNQLIHGGATWNSGTNRKQVRDGRAMLLALVPLFIDLMMDNPPVDWGNPQYPVVD